jgi:hypothetical protein
MPAIITLKAYPAKRSDYGSLQVIFDLTGKPDPMATESVTVRNTAEAMTALETYKAKAAVTGLSLAVCMRLKDGQRAPNGFKAANSTFYHPVNI